MRTNLSSKASWFRKAQTLLHWGLDCILWRTETQRHDEIWDEKEKAQIQTHDQEQFESHIHLSSAAGVVWGFRVGCGQGSEPVFHWLFQCGHHRLLGCLHVLQTTNMAPTIRFYGWNHLIYETVYAHWSWCLPNTLSSQIMHNKTTQYCKNLYVWMCTVNYVRIFLCCGKRY